MRTPLCRFLVLATLAILPQSAGAQIDSAAATPPVANKVPRTEVVHGDTRVDDYYWLRKKTDPAVIAYLKAENAYTAAVMKPTEDFQKALYQEMLGRIKETDLSVPYQLGDYLYFSRTEKGKQYRVECRKRGPDGKEEVILDLNELAAGKKFLGLGAFQVSDDGNLLAYSIDVTGFREFTLYIKDLRTGKLLADRIGVVNTVSWAADNKTLFYTTEDAAKRPYRLFRHVLGQAKRTLLFEEKDELYRVFLQRSRDRVYQLLTSASSITTEARFLRSDRPTGEWRVLLPRERDHMYSADHRDGLFYIRTNRGAKNYRLVTAPVADPRPQNWKELIPHQADVLLESLMLFKDHGVVFQRSAGLQQLRVIDLRSGKSHLVELPEPIYSVFPGNNPEFKSGVFRFSYQSLVTPLSVFDYDMATRRRKLLKQMEVRGGYDPSRYTSERLFATASDGTRIPISIVYKKGLKREGGNPLLLQGYGAYGSSVRIGFAANRLSLLDRGVICAAAHIRGGKDLGQVWHDQGKMMHKRNTFTDFIAAGEHLVAQKSTSPDKLVIQGASAGGLLIGAVVNMRPDLCKAAVLQVPFVDVINTMLDESLPLTVQEFLEWGNPKIKKEYDYIKSYCPYTNISAKSYPALLVMTSLNDSAVMYWEPAKYVAKLRAHKTDKNVLLLKTNLAAGHGGASGRYDALKETAFTYAFILNQMGITK
jgi:oligopeptidase B